MFLGSMEAKGEVGNVLSAGAEQPGAIRGTRGLEVAEGLPTQRRAGPPWAAWGGSEHRASVRACDPAEMPSPRNLVSPSL